MAQSIYPTDSIDKESAWNFRTHKWYVRSQDWEYIQEEGMATHSNTLAWRIPWTEEPGGLYSIGMQKVGHDWGNLAGMHVQLYVMA